MWVRKRIEVNPRQLLFGFGQCVVRGDREQITQRIADLWHADESFVCLSVRSGFDLLLHSAAWPAGSEIIMSGLTIPDMPMIVREHGLVPIGVDIELDSMGPQIDQLERAITPNTKAIVVAHLFGGLCDITPILKLARQHDLMVIEDCAQAYVGSSYQGHPEADVSMFSFGPIKTNTALGGAVFRVRDAKYRERLQDEHDNWPVQSRWSFGRRIGKYAMVKLLSTRLVCGTIYRILRMFGKNHDRVASSMARGFAGPHFFRRIRRRPSWPLLSLLHKKLASYDASTAERRSANGQRFAQAIGADQYVLGAKMNRPTFWVLPMLVENPQELVQHLWDAGFDASTHCSLDAISGDDRWVASFILKHIVFFPFHSGMPVEEIDRMANVVRSFGPICPALPVVSEKFDSAEAGTAQIAVEPATALAKSAMIGEVS